MNWLLIFILENKLSSIHVLFYAFVSAKIVKSTWIEDNLFSKMKIKLYILLFCYTSLKENKNPYSTTSVIIIFFITFGRKVGKGPTIRHNGYAHDYQECPVRSSHKNTLATFCCILQLYVFISGGYVSIECYVCRFRSKHHYVNHCVFFKHIMWLYFFLIRIEW